MHGGVECNTHALVELLVEWFSQQPDAVSSDVALFFVPALNPDGCALGTRFNARGVDLNRNWDTADWTRDAEWSQGTVTGSGGDQPFSEPETNALQSWLLALRDEPHSGTVHVLFYHAAVPPTGLVLPGYSQAGQLGQRSDALAHAFSDSTGYRYSTDWVGDYIITGEAIRWADEHGLVAIDVELPDRGDPETIPDGWSETHFETNLRGLLAVVNLPVTPQPTLIPEDGADQSPSLPKRK